MKQGPPLGLKVCMCFSDFQPHPLLQEALEVPAGRADSSGETSGSLRRAGGSQLSLNHHGHFPAQPLASALLVPLKVGGNISWMIYFPYISNIACMCAVPLLGPALLLDGMSAGNLLGCQQPGRKMLVVYVQS